MKYVAVHELKAHCSALLAEVSSKLESIIVTKHGKPVAKIVPIEKSSEEMENPLENTVLYYGDIESPIDVDWEAGAD